MEKFTWEEEPKKEKKETSTATRHHHLSAVDDQSVNTCACSLSRMSGKSCDLMVTGLDFGLLHALVERMLKDDAFAYATVLEGHPLEKKFTMRWSMKNGEAPLDGLKRIVIAMTQYFHWNNRSSNNDTGTMKLTETVKGDSLDPECNRPCCVEFSGATCADMNAFRRSLLEDLPTLAVHSVHIRRNTCCMIDDILAHRLAMIPICYKSGEVPPSDAESSMEINVLNPEHSNEHLKTIMSTQFRTSDEFVKMAFGVDGIPVTKLASGQALDCKVILRTGYGSMHIKHSAVSSCSIHADSVLLEPVGQLTPLECARTAATSIVRALVNFRSCIATCA